MALWRVGKPEIEPLGVALGVDVILEEQIVLVGAYLHGR